MDDTDPFLAGLQRGEMASDHFSIVAHVLTRDRKLSNGAKGLFSNLASHREGFIITEDFMASQSTDGIKAIRSQVAELRAHGYIYRGQRSRYPAGTRNKDGKHIGGALGPYAWYVTDKPSEIAAILVRYADEQHPPAGSVEPAGRTYLPLRPVVLTSEDAAATNLPPETGGSSDQAKRSELAGRNYLPKPTGGFGRSIEEQTEENQVVKKIKQTSVRPATNVTTRGPVDNSRVEPDETDGGVSPQPTPTAITTAAAIVADTDLTPVQPRPSQRARLAALVTAALDVGHTERDVRDYLAGKVAEADTATYVIRAFEGERVEDIPVCAAEYRAEHAGHDTDHAYAVALRSALRDPAMECEHGQPAGRFITMRTGQPRCIQCQHYGCEPVGLAAG